jgi:hypothetical protein
MSTDVFEMRLGQIRVKNHDFTPKNHIFFPILVGGGRARAGCAPPWISGIYILTNPVIYK